MVPFVVMERVKIKGHEKNREVKDSRQQERREIVSRKLSCSRKKIEWGRIERCKCENRGRCLGCSDEERAKRKGKEKERG